MATNISAILGLLTVHLFNMRKKNLNELMYFTIYFQIIMRSNIYIDNICQHRILQYITSRLPYLSVHNKISYTLLLLSSPGKDSNAPPTPSTGKIADNDDDSVLTEDLLDSYKQFLVAKSSGSLHKLHIARFFPVILCQFSPDFLTLAFCW